MRSTFMGLETSKRGMFTQQSALYTVGHNISNANTLGYSRQRVNMQATAGFPGVGLNAPTMPGFLGTGVEAGSIQRIRDSFVDKQFRQESNKLGYWESRSKAIAQMEDVLNEPTQFGLAKTLNEFWQSLHDLAGNPENSGARAVVVERGIAVADSFNYMHNSLTDIKNNLGTEIGVSTINVNSIIQQIADLNRQISDVEPNGYMPNDLYDARDVLLDELSTYFPIETEKIESGGRALKIAEGSLKVTIKMKDGGDITIIDGKEFAQLRTTGSTDDEGVMPEGTFDSFYLVRVNADKTETLLNRNMIDDAGAVPVGHAHFYDQGKMKSLINSYGTPDGKGLYPEMLDKLDLMAKEFAEEFNGIYAAGFPKEGNNAPNWFFIREDITANFSASNLIVNNLLIDDPNLLRSSNALDEEGNGKNAQALADLFSDPMSGLNNSTVQSYFQSMIGQLGVDGMQANRLTFNTETLKNAVEHRRASISSVSLDEEMTDMIKFQQSYNASARMITVVDETLDKIINGMGHVGR